MDLNVRGLPFEVPKYSLTGDILSFKRCGLQYRYYNGSSLPPSRPVQLWTGEFVHGVLEEAYLYWDKNRTPFPWPCNISPWPRSQRVQGRPPNDIGVLGDLIEDRLGAAGKIPRSGDARASAYNRVEAAINILAPQLFPIITLTEEKIIGTRQMPRITGAGGQVPRGDRYELAGVVDVISSVQMEAHTGNLIVNMLQSAIHSLADRFDVIVDYKAARRPPIAVQGSATLWWDVEAWQVQTYAWLRSQQPGANPIGAGILVYVNELAPSSSDLLELKREIAQGQTDEVPLNGSKDYYALHRWNQGDPVPAFTELFLLRRAIRIVSVGTQEIVNAVQQIDQVVCQIESCALQENHSGVIPPNWPKSGADNDCNACDFRRFCPSPAGSRGTSTRQVVIPEAPG